MERYINKLQAEMDKKRDREERFMGKEYDGNVIGQSSYCYDEG